MNKYKLSQIGIFLSVFLFLTGLTGADVINVPGDFGTIQAAIADGSTVGGDEVVVAPGTYNESINFLGKAITVRSASGDPADTIINGAGNFHVVQCVTGETASTVLQGFTITGGNANGATPANRGGGIYCEDSSPSIIDCIISGNMADFGGGMLNQGTSSPAIIGCTFSGNMANATGAGLYNNIGSSPTITGCTFTDNTPSTDGGGMYNRISSPTVTDCIFIDNMANSGAGMLNISSSHPVITNCIFSGNVANFNGGAMVNNINCNPTIVNCTFSSNTANLGGALFNDSSSPDTHNSIFWNNSDNGGMDESAQMHTISGTPTVNYSNLMAGWTGVGGNNINADPLFVDADGADDIVGTIDDNLRLQNGSLCIDAGDNTALPTGITTDLDGNARISHSIVEMGAYEFQDADGDGVPDSSDLCPGFDDTLDGDGDGLPDDCDTPSVHNLTQATDHFTLQSAIIAAVSGDEIEADPGTYVEAIDFLGKAITVRSASGDPADTIIDGTGNFHVVQCISGETVGTVLQGFTITGGIANGGSFPNNAGGGMYCDGASPTVTHCTFSGNTAFDGGGMFNNSTSNPTVSNCTFSGNTGGMYNLSSSPMVSNCSFSANNGGGMYNDSSSPTVTDCSFSANNSGGMLNDDGSPTVSNCTFSGNTAGFDGGGMSNVDNSSPTVSNCTFSGNMADIGGRGGGMYNNQSFPTVIDCSFSANTASNGGGMCNSGGSNPTIVNCTFSGNTATFNGGGGGMYTNNNSGLTLTNCTFSGNTANIGGGIFNENNNTTAISNCVFNGNTAMGVGGGMYNSGSFFSIPISHCTFHANSATNGGAIYNSNSSPSIINTIIKNNNPNGLVNSGGVSKVTYSNIQGGFTGNGNFDSDPFFVDADGADDTLGTEDDDLRVLATSPCIDAGDTTDVLIENNFDRDGNARAIDDPDTLDSGLSIFLTMVDEKAITDIGAYEFQPAVPCDSFLEGDINCDGIVNLLDQAILAANWLKTTDDL